MAIRSTDQNATLVFIEPHFCVRRGPGFGDTLIPDIVCIDVLVVVTEDAGEGGYLDLGSRGVEYESESEKC